MHNIKANLKDGRLCMASDLQHAQTMEIQSVEKKKKMRR